MARGRSGSGTARRNASVAVGVVVTGLAGTLGWLMLDNRSAPAGQSVPTKVLTGQAAVVRADVAERNEFSGSLGLAGASVPVASATFPKSPAGMVPVAVYVQVSFWSSLPFPFASPPLIAGWKSSPELPGVP